MAQQPNAPRRVKPPLVAARVPHPPSKDAIPSPRIFTAKAKPAPSRKPRCAPHWAAAIPPLSRSLRLAKSFSIWDRAEALTFCSPRAASGPTGKAYGLDMTDEMLTLAEENKRKSGLTNVEFLKGEIENIPLPDNSVDVIVSNCVINLSGDKDRVLREAFRVLKPGGRFAISDVVVRGEVPDSHSQEHGTLGRLRSRRANRHGIPAKARRRGIRFHRHRTDAHLQHRRRQRIPESRRHRCRRSRTSNPRQIHQRLRACAKVRRQNMLRPHLLRKLASLCALNWPQHS